MTEAHPFGPSSHAPLEDPAEMPECYPIKGNDDSMLYHRPDSMNYGATIAEVWFTSPSAAEAAGFSLSNTHPKNASSADFEPGGSQHPCSAAQVTGIVASAGGAGGGDGAAATGAGGVSAAADAAEAAASGAADAGKGGLGKAAAVGGAGVAGIAAAGAAGLGGAKDAAASAAGGAKDAVSGVADLGGAKDAAASAAGGAKDAAASAAGGAKDAVSGVGDSAKGAVAGATGAAAGVAGMAASAGSDASDAASTAASTASASTSSSTTSSSTSSSSSASTTDGDHPFGPGSHVPFADVHKMPECYPIKGNADSMKYHRPDSSGYKETKAEVWFVSPSAAEAAGFVLSGSHPKDSSSADFEPGGSGHPCSADQLRGMGLGGLLIGGAAAGAVASTLVSSGSADADIEVEVEKTETVVREVETAEVAEPETERVVYRAADTPVEDVEVESKGISGKTAAAAAGGAAIVGGLAAAASAKGDDIEVTKPKVSKPDVSKPKVSKPKVSKPEVTKPKVEKPKVQTTRASSSVKETTRVTADRAAASGGGSVGGKVPTAKGGFGWGWLKWLLPLLLLAALVLLLLWACGGDDDVTPVAQPAAVPTATAVPPTATAVPEPTATAVPDPTATPVPDPTATPEPDPTATPEPAPAVVAACADLLGTLEDNGFSILVTAATLAGFEDELAGPDPLTIFAPTDAAFEAVPEETLNAALSNEAVLASILTYHIVPGAVTSSDLSETGVTTLNGANVAVRLDQAAPRINYAPVSQADIKSGDCVVHGIDALLTPPILLTTAGLTSLNDAVGGGTITFEPGTSTLTAADTATLAAICNLVANESSARSLPPINWESTGDATIDAARAAAIEAALADCGPPVFNYAEIMGDYEAPAPEFTG